MSTFTIAIRKLFALPRREPVRRIRKSKINLSQILPGKGECTLITGPSGSGKSQLLRQLKQHTGEQIFWIDPSTITLKDEPVIDLVCREMAHSDPQEKIVHSLNLLSRVGLAEAWTYLRKPAELSDGQRWRLLLAISIQRANKAARNRGIVILATDEFAALLDRVTAIITARALKKLIDSSQEIGVIVATSHNDLIRALDPHTHVHCDFGENRLLKNRLEKLEKPNRTKNKNH